MTVSVITLCAMMATQIYAEGQLKEIQALENSQVRTTLNGQAAVIGKPPIHYEGSTYYSIRDLAAMLGVDVKWDFRTNTVKLTTADQLLYEKYKDLNVIDIHNHDAPKYEKSLPTWQKYNMSKTVLFGNVSEPSAIETDRMSWEAYEKYPERIIPFFSGFDMHQPEGLETVKANLEKGYLGIGETVAASSVSPFTSKVKWKAQHPMDGNLPEVYRLAAEYKVPVLLHIDPTSGPANVQLEEALLKYPDTKIIFAHNNVRNAAANMDRQLGKYPNLYIDFFAGYSAYNPGSTFPLSEYVDVMEKYPDRFFLSTDGAVEMTYDQALYAMYEMLDMLKPETRKKIASGNFQALIDAQKPTQTQIQQLQKLAKEKQLTINIDQLNKHEANVKLFELHK
jgi:predicted TIM-barrel fold metal-dependent hydrolase